MKFLVINGPNLNNLGRREIGHYGSNTLSEIEDLIRSKAEELQVEVEFFQSNHEGAIVDYLQSASVNSSGIIINAGALTHYGLSLRDALLDVALPVIEVHLSNIHAREQFRHHSVIVDIAIGQIVGLGSHSYLLALEYLAHEINKGT